MTILESIILAIVEGLTEFLPVSSTGHMILTQGALGMESTPFLRAFTVMIQFGAILSVVVLYYKRFFTFRIEEGARQLPQRWQWVGRFSFYIKLLVGLIPAAVIGLLLEEQIDQLLDNVYVVATTLFLGGIFMLFIDRIWPAQSQKAERPSYRNAFVIGCFQTIAMIPGVSRSMATIVGGLQQRLTRRAATEFSFFLAVPTMLGATLLKGYKLLSDPVSSQILQENWMALLVGNVVAFVVALLAIKFFINYVTRYGFKLFGYYRI
ncbi:undecaprenyl-diphosphate phosphatase, partial [uncultured Porphyromonas sp.]|uniref:undecaprenyl-diphosphate phosphatase n=1 Tax=uncultured Porphyromonas sp. TaxID=159274 RepID=UPI0028057E92